ncbi:mandelate racemase [Pantoea sp. Ap-967]|uniref:mandelate racemase/muconate lactonizing enzyme family protein n=1 Tax=Pantoea sp. Ap-967 TaxID=2608362 RepID=UPI00141EBADE|nr:enolase C-terminal domain-like protein [Pantoea sp. Ap-967]NIE75907.1 mandelate racemase [Pantoea sp. Ap-967]
MKISEIHVYQVDLPVVNGPYKMSHSSVWSLKSTLVKIVADNGQFGWGETCPVGSTYNESYSSGAAGAIAEMAQGLIGTSVFPVPLHRRMNDLLTGHQYAKAALDIAAHDLLGKHLGLSVADLLGGALVDRVPSYYALNVASPEEAARKALDKCAEGYPRLQLKVGGRPVEEDIETIRRVWEAIRSKSVRLVIDANRSLLTRDVLSISRECHDIPLVIEQPCNNVEDLQAIRPIVRHAIYMDENTINPNTAVVAAGTGLVDGFGLKVTQLGGLHMMRAMRDICAIRGLPHTCDDTWGGDIMAAACTHIGATVAPRLLEGVWIAAPYIEGNYDSENGIKVESGHITVPSKPGLGIIPDESTFSSPVASFG